MLNPFSRYCEQVCRLIRSKDGRAAVTEELTAHLEDHAAALEDRGVPPDVARERAVQAMGDPYALGAALDRLYPYCPRRLPILFTALALLFLLLGAFLLSHGFPLEERFLFPGDYPSPPEEPVLSTGTARGTGRLGIYTIRAEGSASLVLPDYEDARREVHIPVTISHPQFWLEHPGDGLEYANATELSPSSYRLNVRFSPQWSRLLTTGGELIFSLEEDASSTAPLSLRAWNGEQVTFTVTWDKEVGAK